LSSGAWYYSPEHGQLCQVIETQTIWGETVCRVWLPGKDAIVQPFAIAHKIMVHTGIASTKVCYPEEGVHG